MDEAPPPPSPSFTSRLRARLDAWARFELYALIWLPPAVSALWTKYMMLPRQRDRIGPWERLSFFREDILVSFILLPFVIPWLLRKRLKSGFLLIGSALLSVLSVLLLFTQLKSYRNVGQLFNHRSLVAAIRWGLHDAKSTETFVPAAGIAKLVLMLGFVVIAAALAYVCRARLAQSALTHSRVGRGVLAVGLAAALVPWLSGTPSGFFHRSALVASVAALGDSGDETADAEGPPSSSALAERYRTLSRTPAAAAPSPFDGSSRDSNVLLFVFETGPARSLPMGGDLTDFPNLKRLATRGFVGLRHHSAAPYTSRSLYALFSGVYPWNLADNEIQRHPKLKLPGFARVLAEKGYQTSTYNPHLPWTDPDEEMFQAVGFQKNYFADPVTREKQEHSADLAVTLDRTTLAKMTQDIVGWTRANRRWAVAYLPQIGHGPWQDVSAKRNLTDTYARGRALMALQDQWLGELLAVLEKEKVLEQTLIVVTADHGVRNAKEDPKFQVGMAEDLSFQVPFVLYAPRALGEPQRLEWPTSHVDVGPTLLALLGLSPPGAPATMAAQGWPLWDRRLAERRTFFVGQFYFGADAFFDGGRYFMRSALSEKVYVADRFHFSLDNEVPRDAPEYQHTARTLRELGRLQRDWAVTFSLPSN